MGLKLKLNKVDEAVDCYQALQKSAAGGAGGGADGGGSQAVSVLGRLMRALVARGKPAEARALESQLPGVSTAQVRARASVSNLAINGSPPGLRLCLPKRLLGLAKGWLSKRSRPRV